MPKTIDISLCPFALAIVFTQFLGCNTDTSIWTQMSTKSTLMFDGRKYQISRARIFAVIPDPYWCDTYNDGANKGISWFINFQTADDSDQDRPRNIHFEKLPIRVRNWCNLTGFSTSWDTARDPGSGDSRGWIYIDSNILIDEGSVQIVSRNANTFRVVASGRNEEGGEFSIDASAQFVGVDVRGSGLDTDDSIRERLRDFLDDQNLEGTPFKTDRKYDSGVEMGNSVFRPNGYSDL